MKGDDADLVLGVHAVEAALSEHPDRIEWVWFSQDATARRLQGLLDATRRLGVRFTMVPKARLDELAAGSRHQGVAARCAPRPLRHERELESLLRDLVKPIVLVLDGIQDPHNLGACLRTADAAGAHAVVIPKANSAPVTAVARRAACGAAERVALFQVANLARVLAQLQKAGLWTVGAAADGATELYEADLTAPVALILGGEQRGLRRLTREHCDLVVRIPLQGLAESLNVSVATGVMLYEVVRQRRAVMPQP